MITTQYVNQIIAQAQRAAAEYGYQVALKTKHGEDPDNLRRKVQLCLDGANVLNGNNDLTDGEKQIIIDRLLTIGGIGTFSTTPIKFTTITVVNNNPNNFLLAAENGAYVFNNKVRLGGDLIEATDIN